MLKIKYKIPLIVFVATLIMTGIFTSVSYSSNQKIINGSMQAELSVVSNLIQNALIRDAARAAAQASLIVNLPPVQKMMRERQRDALLNYIVPVFKIQNERFGIAQTHFYTPPATSFLRGIVDIQKWGEDLSKIRELVLKANTEQRPLQGVAVSNAGASIRAIDIIKDEKGFIGSLEVQLDFKNLLENLKKESGFDSAVFINNEIMTKISVGAEKPDPDYIVGDFRNVDSTDWKKIYSVVSPDMLSKVNDLTFKIQKFSGSLDGIVIVPLLDFKGAQIGSIVAMRSFESYAKQLQDNLFYGILYALLQSFGLAILIFVLLNLTMFRPLDEANHQFAQIANGQPKDLTALTARNDEIGLLARNIEQQVNH